MRTKLDLTIFLSPAKPIRAGHAPVPQGIRGGQPAPQKIISDDSLKRKSMKGELHNDILTRLIFKNIFTFLELEQS